MPTLSDKFYWYDTHGSSADKETNEDKYKRISSWASHARGVNPNVFDELTTWLSGSGQWSDQEFVENKKIFLDNILGRFLEQNRALRSALSSLETSGLVNPAVFGALDRFDDELTGNTHALELCEIVSRVFQDFSELRKEDIRKNFAGSVTGSTGTDSVDVFGYVNFLKDCDASVQWTLFMPELVRQQQDGFKMTGFEYRKLPAMRFIGIERDFSKDPEGLSRLLHTLDLLSEKYRCGLSSDTLLLHHNGKGVDTEPCHGLWGRFLAKDAPVPDGFAFVDFVPQNDGKSGPPYLSRFAYAEFSGNPDSMHRQEGFDSDAMYDVTRNMILGQNVRIPYPDKYWTAEVFPDGFTKNSTIYLFCAET